MPDPTNVIDLPWVPVITDGGEETVSLRAVLTQAHLFTGLGTSLLPVEREAMLRFLESLTAAVLHGQEPEDVADLRRIDNDAVEKFFATHHHLFDLADDDRPFMQEWHTTGLGVAYNEKHWRDVKELHLRQPGQSSALWGVIQEHREATDPAVLVLLLLVSWFHGKPSNGAGAAFYRPTSGDKRSPIAGAPSGGGRDSVFHLMGPSLAETVLHNIPEGWLCSPSSPAWLDQDHEPRPAEFSEPGGLWRCTWAANRALVLWVGGSPHKYTNGVTRRFVPPLSSDEAKDDIDRLKKNAKAVTRTDYCRIQVPDLKKPGVTHPLVAPEILETAEGFVEWYRANIADAVAEWARRPRVLPATRDCRVGFHNERGDTYGNRSLSTWTEIPLRELNITGEAATALRLVTGHVGELSKHVEQAMRRGFDVKKSPSSVRQIKRFVYASLDDPVLLAVLRAGDGEVLDDEAVRAQMSKVAVRAFVDATAPLLEPATAAAVYRSRAEYVRLSQRKLIAPSKEGKRNR